MGTKDLSKNHLLLLLLIIFLSVLVGRGEAVKLKLRVKVAIANIRLKPTIESMVISKASLGTILDSEEKVGEWYEVNLPPDKSGVVVSAYIHQSIVEVVEEVKEIPKEEEVKEEKPPEVIPEPIEPKKDLSKDADYLRWKEEYGKAERISIKWKKYANIGMYTSIGVALIGLPVAVILAKENYLVPVIVMSAVTVVATSLWFYADIKRGDALGRMTLLMNRGKTKGYLTVSMNPKRKLYVISFSLEF